MSEDRSSEFFALCQALPGPSARSGGGSEASKSGGRYGEASRRPTEDLRDFHQKASDISRDIAGTAALLNELTLLAKRRTLFSEDDSQVNALILRIKANTQSLHSRLDEVSRSLSHAKRSNSQAGQEATNVVGQLQQQFVRTTEGFKSVLQLRSANIKHSFDRRTTVWGDATSLEHKPAVYSTPDADDGLAPLLASSAPRLDLTSAIRMHHRQNTGESTGQLPRPRGTSSNDENSGLRFRHAHTDATDSLPTFSSSHSSFNLGEMPVYTPFDLQRQEAQLASQQQLQLIPDHAYLQERADAMSQVETNIVELGTIFNKLAVMVSEHREMVQRVEDNVDDANETINLSLHTLGNTLDKLRTNRALFWKVFAVLVFFIVLFITFFA